MPGKLITKIDRTNVNAVLSGELTPTDEALLQALWDFGHEQGSGIALQYWVRLQQTQILRSILAEIKDLRKDLKKKIK